MHNENLHEHDHNHEEYHTHEHSHSHCHDHEHEQDEDSNLSKEERTLKILLSHWVEHNKSHEESFKEWIEKAKVMGKEDTSVFIQKAVELMEKADEMLTEAQKHM